ncbi:uncharacterized protein LOC120847398 [Ixodes scapularis]|uniref:uncharacterized protein LOC120847398 n=1 Tax=Ixodes scapularis TaxID=6945 RepID=UPI001A9F0B11|nr:uncharacterized protein LOC120847398 [Ixodes scapularis]
MGHGPVYPRCMHKDLGEKQWIAPGSAAHKKLKAIATAPLFLKDVRQLSPHAQTYGLGSFHSVLNRFAPKSTAFSYECMAARTTIAIMHFNKNSARLQAETREGHKQWHVKAPKARKGALTVCSHKTPVTFGYVEKLHQQVLERCKTHPTFKVALAERPPKVPPSFFTQVFSTTMGALTNEMVSTISQAKSRYKLDWAYIQKWQSLADAATSLHDTSNFCIRDK